MGERSTAFGKELKSLKILTVEDNGSMRLLLRTMLNTFGISTIRQARDGTDGLTELQLYDIDLVISDWEMQPMNGRDFITSVRAIGNEPICFTPIIVLTGHASRSLITEAFEIGATHLLVKPVTPASLLHRIEWVLNDAREFEAAGGIYRQPMIIQEREGLRRTKTVGQSTWALE
ncbi:response regulator [Parvibaculum sp.]|uniref:response regulator n=1 Tax=Parvibaculum sp. TaxID=2024848 RepID=UPI001B092CFE|nr:response regulator [Parvibaculum sp.]MBO6635298.1 response regulator [Parvibaculum sp.]MBO6678957.1 response regulator [Parvibaculum sp.]MBO6685807.1 response regulator [Parvibaculum sp.]MBO6903720.1 response regulator [Parvibaculum sp.]